MSVFFNFLSQLVVVYLFFNIYYLKRQYFFFFFFSLLVRDQTRDDNDVDNYNFVNIILRYIRKIRVFVTQSIVNEKKRKIVAKTIIFRRAI